MLAPEQSGGSLFSTGGLSAGFIAETQVATQKLLDSAKSGGFKITEAGVKPMRDALLDVRNKIENLSTARGTLDQAPMLGNHTYGHTVAAHDQKGASQDPDSAGRVLDELKQMIIQADEALARAAGVYKETENQTQDVLKGFQV
ncbi:hypothetical protein [Amycolatopsis sp.]|jgi:hypothetical protein|uniref:hypothetical protein n=1 Tax=Amycolatopsis sp. TaxID=37632 RepID=UPI002DFBA26D|nr:hypothetical protein [Amycolatopsis sp.]